MSAQVFPFILIVLFSMAIASCQERRDTQGVIDYFGQQIPKQEPKVFAPDLISLKNRWEGNANFSSDGKELYFNVFEDSLNTKSIYRSTYENGHWSQAKMVVELGDFDNWEPFLSPSGQELYFVSSRPPGKEEWDGRIWKSTRNADYSWGTPAIVPIDYPTENGFWFPNFAANNAQQLFFGGNIDAIRGKGKGELYQIDLASGLVTSLEALNSEEEDWDPFIAPDGSYILWASERKGGFGGTDLYVAFKTDKGWGAPMNLGDKINTTEYEVAPRVSTDGKILFFDRPINGSQDIYWVSTAVIHALKS